MQTDFLPEHLPTWMQQPRRSLDWGILLAAALGLIAAWAFLIRPGVPAYSELIHSGFMASDIADAFREGQLFVRWSPHAFSGYGAPIPVFIPQGAPLIAALAEQLLTGDLASALRLVLTGSLICAAVGQYLLCRFWIGPSAALMASALYVFSPILGLSMTHITGDLAGVVGMALLPYGLWAASRSATNNSIWDVPLTAFVFTALLYIDPYLAASGAAMAIMLTLAVQKRRAVFKLAGALAAAVGLFAPFWLPAVTYLDKVIWHTSELTQRAALSLIDLITPPKLIDPILLNPSPQFTLGLILPVFAFIGACGSIVYRRNRRFMLIMLIVAALSAAAAVSSSFSWPTYLLTMSCATLGGLIVEWRIQLPSNFRRIVLPTALIMLLIASPAVWLSPFGPSTTDFSPAAQIEYERKGFGIAVLPSESLVPSTIREGLPADRSLIESYGSQPLIRIRPGTPARVTPISSGTHGHSWQVSTTIPTSITLSLAYFPGWQATLDGQLLTTVRDPSSGLINIAVPQTTNGTLHVSLHSTPEDNFAWLIALAAGAWLFIWIRFRLPSEPLTVPIFNVQELRLTSFAVAAVGIALVSAAVPDGAINLRAEPFSSLRMSTPLTAISDPLLLLAYEFVSTRVHSGEPFGVTLYWSASQQPTINYGVRLVLTDIDRRVNYILTTPAPPGNLPTRRWLSGYMVYDSYVLHVPADLTPGTYQLSIEAFPCETSCELGHPIRFRDSLGIERPTITLPSILTIADD